MSIELKIPEIGESVTEVTIGEWRKTEADHVERDEPIVIIESDKATVEIPAPESGRLAKILKRSGETAGIGETIGRLEVEDATGAETGGASSRGRGPRLRDTAAEQGSEPSSPEDPDKRDGAPPRQKEANKGRPVPAAEETADEARSSDGAASTDAEEGRADSEARYRAAKRNGAEAPEPTQARSGETDATAPVQIQRGRREERPVPMSPIRRRIAERLVRAQATTAFLSTFNEIDMAAVHAVRRDYQEEFQKKHGVKLGLMSFFVKASIEALKAVPGVNAEIRDETIVYREYYDIGVAVGGGKGLVVPVLRDAQTMTFAQIEQAIQEFARRAERNQLKPGDLEGGTFTISNGGIYGSLLSTPIINAPQSAILGMHAIQERPVAREGQILVRPMMYVALTYDHRVVDGREAVTFLKRIKDCVESPYRMLLQL